MSPDPRVGRAWWRAFLAATRLELRQLYGSRIMVAIALLWILVAAIEIQSSLRVAEYGTRILAVSAYLAERLVESGVPLITCTLAYFAAELVWRERLVRIDGLVDATPASNGAFLLAKLAVIVSLPLVLTLLGLATAVAFHLTSAGLPVQPLVYLAELWFLAYPIMLFGVAVLTIQLVAPDRWSGIIGGLVLVVVRLFGDEFGLEHPVWRYGAAPSVSHSELDGFGSGAYSFAAFMGYWTLVAIVLLGISWMLWRRGRVDSLQRRLRTGWRQLAVPGRMALAASVGAAGLAGTLVHHETVTRGGWRTRAAAVTWSAGYERRYRRLATLPHPQLAALDMQVDLEPSERVARVRATATIVNTTDRPIDTLWIAFQRDIAVERLTIPDQRGAGTDRVHAMHWLVPRIALQPGDSLALTFATRIDRGGIRAEAPRPDVAGNGTFLLSTTLQPWFGYIARYELERTSDRDAAGLGEPSTRGGNSATSLDSLVARAHAGRGTPWITVRTVVSTAADQEPFAPGERRRRWLQDGRRFVEFVTPAPINPAFAIASGRFVQRRQVHRGTTLEFWHHPGHDVNLPHIMRIAGVALDELGSRFGPYPHASLRMVEVPESWRFGAFATPGMLFFTEHRGLLTDPRAEDVDLLTRRVAHEIGHQWWGHTVAPLPVDGSLTIIEGLAKYAEQRVVAAMHGDSAIPPILAFDHDRFLDGRATARDSEPTLMSVQDQDHLVYGKAALAFHALHRTLGDSAMTRALRDLVQREGGPRGAATMRQLHSILHAHATTGAQRAAIDEWLVERTLYDLRADTLIVTPAGDSADVHAVFMVRRLAVRDGADVELPMPSGTTVLVALRDQQGRTVDERAVAVRAGRAILARRVAGTVATAEIDPRVERIDRDRSNNNVRAHSPR